MNEIVQSCACFGVVLSLAAFYLGVAVQKKWKNPLLVPIITASVVCIVLLLALNIDYQVFYDSAQPLTYLLTPATVSLAIPMYRQLEKLKKNYLAILVGILSGVVASAATILALSLLFGLDHANYVTLLPKSVTTVIAMGMSEELGGVVAITVASVVVTGMMGNCLAPLLCKLFRIADPVARGLAIGTASHAMGTAKAVEMGEVEGAMSGLSIAVAGLMTVVVVQIFAPLL